jgi:hypothetical protein
MANGDRPSDEGAKGAGELPRAIANVLLCRSLTSRNAKYGCYAVVGLSLLLGVIPWVNDLVTGVLKLPIY